MSINYHSGNYQIGLTKLTSTWTAKLPVNRTEQLDCKPQDTKNEHNEKMTILSWKFDGTVHTSKQLLSLHQHDEWVFKQIIYQWQLPNNISL